MPAVNGTVQSVTTLGDLSQVVTFLLLTATLFWTCIKIAKALKDWIWDEIEIRGRSTACRQCLGGV